VSTRKITQISFWPEGCDPDGFDGIDWMIVVEWRGQDKYAILQRGSRDIQLSRAGNWKICPLPMQRRQYRFTYAEAVAAAEKAVEGPLVHGMNWKEFQVWRAAKRAAGS
jgi:hypothetical protein